VGDLRARPLGLSRPRTRRGAGSRALGATHRLAELKARCDDLARVRARLSRWGRHERTVRQIDTYFRTARGRLKLREVDRTGELIHYQRPDRAAVKPSDVVLVPVTERAKLRSALTRALGTSARVAKVREIWRWEGVQVHLDRVDGLGTFVEFEKLVRRAGPGAFAAARRHLARLAAKLALPRRALIAGSYADLMRAAIRPRAGRRSGSDARRRGSSRRAGS
jgi:adenylate cyclase class 2